MYTDHAGKSLSGKLVLVWGYGACARACVRVCVCVCVGGWVGGWVSVFAGSVAGKQAKHSDIDLKKQCPSEVSRHCVCVCVRCLQGDEEAKRQLPVTPMCDRNSVVVSTNQLRFIQYLLKVRCHKGARLPLNACLNGQGCLPMPCVSKGKAASQCPMSRKASCLSMPCVFKGQGCLSLPCV